MAATENPVGVSAEPDDRVASQQPLSRDAQSPSAEPNAGGSALRRALGRLRGEGVLDETVLVVSLLALSVLVKLLWLTHVDVYWDAGSVWHFARQWSYENDFSHAHWTHHMARFGLSIPAFLVQRLFGTAAANYYVVPILAFTLQVWFIYLLGRRLSGRAAGVMGALLLIFTDGMTRSASQLLPDGLGGTAAMIGGYAFVRFHEQAGKARLRWLIGIGLACIWCYMVKESHVLFFPGFVLAVLLSRRSPKEAAILVGMIVAYVLLETACFRLFTPYAHRLAIVQEGHGWYPPTTFLGLFERFEELDSSWQRLIYLWLASVLYQVGSPDRRARLMLLVPISFLFLLTFMVRSLDPLQVWIGNKPRYMAPVAGFFALGAGMLAAELCARAWRTLSPHQSLKTPLLRLAQRPGLTCLALCGVLALAAYLPARSGLAEHPLVTMRRDAKIVNDAYRRNLPIVQTADTPRNLNTMAQVYLKPSYLAQSDAAEGGRLPDIPEVVRKTKVDKKSWHYILRDASAYHDGDIEKMLDDGCYVRAIGKSHVELTANQPLPPDCQAPRGEPIPL